MEFGFWNLRLRTYILKVTIYPKYNLNACYFGYYL